MSYIEFRDYSQGFAVKQKLGNGNCAVVMKVQNLHSKQNFAMKYCKFDSITGLVNSLQQIEVIRAIDHKMAIQIFYYFVKTPSVPHLPFQKIQFGIIMQLGQRNLEQDLTMRKMQKNRYYKQQQAEALTFQLVSFFAHMQVKGYMHRDIKPANILLMPEQPVKQNKNKQSQSSRYRVCDFGFAIRQHEFSSKNIAGTANYASPKIQRKFKNSQVCIEGNNYKDDVYSLGITLIQLLSLQSLDRAGIRKLLPKISERYGEKFGNIIDSMVTLQQLLRPDFIHLNSVCQKYQMEKQNKNDPLTIYAEQILKQGNQSSEIQGQKAREKLLLTQKASKKQQKNQNKELIGYQAPPRQPIITNIITNKNQTIKVSNQPAYQQNKNKTDRNLASQENMVNNIRNRISSHDLIDQDVNIDKFMKYRSTHNMYLQQINNAHRYNYAQRNSLKQAYNKQIEQKLQRHMIQNRRNNLKNSQTPHQLNRNANSPYHQKNRESIIIPSNYRNLTDKELLESVRNRTKYNQQLYQLYTKKQINKLKTPQNFGLKNIDDNKVRTKRRSQIHNNMVINTNNQLQGQIQEDETACKLIHKFTSEGNRSKNDNIYKSCHQGDKHKMKQQIPIQQCQLIQLNIKQTLNRNGISYVKNHQQTKITILCCSIRNKLCFLNLTNEVDVLRNGLRPIRQATLLQIEFSNQLQRFLHIRYLQQKQKVVLICSDNKIRIISINSIKQILMLNLNSKNSNSVFKINMKSSQLQIKQFISKNQMFQHILNSSKTIDWQKYRLDQQRIFKRNVEDVTDANWSAFEINEYSGNIVKIQDRYGYVFQNDKLILHTGRQYIRYIRKWNNFIYIADAGGLITKHKLGECARFQPNQNLNQQQDQIVNKVLKMNNLVGFFNCKLTVIGLQLHKVAQANSANQIVIAAVTAVGQLIHLDQDLKPILRKEITTKYQYLENTQYRNCLMCCTIDYTMNTNRRIIAVDYYGTAVNQHGQVINQSQIMGCTWVGVSRAGNYSIYVTIYGQVYLVDLSQKPKNIVYQQHLCINTNKKQKYQIEKEDKNIRNQNTNVKIISDKNSTNKKHFSNQDIFIKDTQARIRNPAAKQSQKNLKQRNYCSYIQ